MGVLPFSSGDEFDLTDKQWVDLYNVLRLHAKTHHGWKPGLDLEGLIQASIEDWLSGKRCRPEGETLEAFLIGVFNSKVSHEWEKETIDISGERPSDEERPVAKPRRIRRRQDVEDLDNFIPPSSYSHQQGDAYRQAEANDIYQKALSVLGDESALIEIFKGSLQGIKPQELADKLGLSIDRLRNEQRRLKRKLMMLRKGWSND